MIPYILLSLIVFVLYFNLRSSKFDVHLLIGLQTGTKTRIVSDRKTENVCAIKERVNSYTR